MNHATSPIPGFREAKVRGPYTERFAVMGPGPDAAHRPGDGWVLEGYASLFGVPDASGDIIRAGAFRETLEARTEPLPMLVEHAAKLIAGVWDEAREDARGLFVRGRIDPLAPGALRAQRLLARGGDGLSIGFVPLVAHPQKRGRLIEDIELIEVSLVTLPMQPLARLTRVFAR